MDKDNRLAILIDGDNIPNRYVTEMMEEIAKYGTPTIKRIYGDWTTSRMSKWKSKLLENAIQPIQQYAYTTGKNSTDSAMIIDAMDILYTGKTDGFCIASSDSDFTRLAIRLRESGQFVLGIGEQKTPEPFIVACNKFVYLEILESSEDSNIKEGASKLVQKLDEKTKRLIRQTIYDCADEDGWANLGEVGSLINKKQPNFDPRNYGYYKLSVLMNELDTIELEERKIQGSNTKHIYVKNKSSKKTKSKK